MTIIREAFFALCSVSMLIVCISGHAADVSFHDELLARMHALEDQGRSQADKMQHIDLRLVDQHERLVRQESTIHEYKQRVAVLERTVTELQQEYKQRVAVLERTVTELQHKHDPDLSEDSSELHDSGQSQDSGESQDDTVDNKPGPGTQQRSINTFGSKEAAKYRSVVQIVGDSGPVAFHAVIKKYGEIPNITVGQNIVFPDVMLNLGGGYHNVHGVFTAPQPGVYFFSTSIVSYTTSHPLIAVNLMKNGAILARSYAHGDAGRHDQGSVTVVTQLAAGDEVWVNLNGPSVTSSFGASYDSFTGCLVILM